MVTRKVGRSKRDAIALAEAQLRDSDSDTNTSNKKPPMAKRRKTLDDTGAAAAKSTRRRGAPLDETVELPPPKPRGKAKLKQVEDAIQKATEKLKKTRDVTVPVGTTQKDVGAELRPPPVVVEVAMPAMATPVVTPRSSISTRNGGSRRVTPTASKKSGLSPSELLRHELALKLERLDPAIKARFGQLVWAKRASFPFWPALILDPRQLPEQHLPKAVKDMDEKCWVQLYGSRDIRQILFTALADWEDRSHPYREGFPKSDFHRLTKLKDTFGVALTEASDHDNLTPEERLKVFTTEVVPSLGLPAPALPVPRKKRKYTRAAKPDTPPSQVSSGLPLFIARTIHSSQDQNRVSAELEKRKRISALVTQDLREPESRYRVGELGDYVAQLRSVVGTQSSDRDWRVQLLLSRLLDEKAFLRADVEKAGIHAVIDQLRGNESARCRALVDTVRNHINNCTLEEWPSVHRSTTNTPTRPSSTPPSSRGTADLMRQRTAPTIAPSLTRSENDRSSAEAIAEAVARSMINASSAFRHASFPSQSVSAPVASTTSQQPAPVTFLSSSSAMASVGISPGIAASSPVGALLFTNQTPPPGSAPSPSAPVTQIPILPTQQNAPERPINSSQTNLTHPGRQTATQSTSSGRSSAIGTAIVARAVAPTAVSIAPVGYVPVSQPVLPVPQPVLPVPAAARSNPSLVIFNKDGTLLDFQTTWTSWIESQAWRLETALGKPIRETLFNALGYNVQTRTMLKGSVFNASPKHELGPKFAVDFLVKHGLQRAEAVRLVGQHWSLPKEVATFRARRDIPSLFTTIRELGVKIAVVTTDRRDVTTKTLKRLGVLNLVDLVGCGDDGVANTPERIWAVCSRLGVSTANTVMVGDTAEDMVLARTAGCALSVGVMGGAADLSDLSAEADVLVPCTTNVIKLLYQYRQQAAIRS